METFLYSASTNGFYLPSVHGEIIPDDAVEISQEEYKALLSGQENGRAIVAGQNGRPVLGEADIPTDEQIRAATVALVQAHLDAAARELRYDSIESAITYADEPVVPKFQAEGQAFRTWRSLVWAKCYAILDEVNAGTRAIPTDDELIAALPVLSLPST